MSSRIATMVSSMGCEVPRHERPRGGRSWNTPSSGRGTGEKEDNIEALNYDHMETACRNWPRQEALKCL